MVLSLNNMILTIFLILFQRATWKVVQLAQWLLDYITAAVWSRHCYKEGIKELHLAGFVWWPNDNLACVRHRCSLGACGDQTTTSTPFATVTSHYPNRDQQQLAQIRGGYQPTSKNKQDKTKITINKYRGKHRSYHKQGCVAAATAALNFGAASLVTITIGNNCYPTQEVTTGDIQLSTSCPFWDYGWAPAAQYIRKTLKR